MQNKYTGLTKGFFRNNGNEIIAAAVGTPFTKISATVQVFKIHTSVFSDQKIRKAKESVARQYTLKEKKYSRQFQLDTTARTLYLQQ